MYAHEHRSQDGIPLEPGGGGAVRPHRGEDGASRVTLTEHPESHGGDDGGVGCTLVGQSRILQIIGTRKAGTKMIGQS